MTYRPPVSPYAAGLAGKCPRCGQGALFKGFLGLRARCEACGLDYAKADAGDGPAVFVIFIVGFVAVAVAFIARYVLYAPLWLAFLFAAAVAIGLPLLLLRPFKATLIALQYQHKAEEGRLEE
ncbi:DUF983 domain-containing protein [Amphiplicatus metriothermophilus]|uniref:Uncharacterized conserved protein, DUF983 family n=1 Tax=Amphiplicatus metriothermophilus TaxID=1519374 RepID=A0A239PK67_9PROT|nr:DUF983 domain-containing protein [Amphiplicatus metriothermophilus]MBB5517948.1 uncharacterized protein (DUF983 family) [Amphiplicatus metriothermophilus]SNT67719.1 Uncharacterized conserved protein, DUF983 family [Amphiplicatus metriothermophilus]